MKQDWLKPVLRTVKGGSSRTESRMTIKQDHSTGLDPSAITIALKCFFNIETKIIKLGSG